MKTFYATYGDNGGEVLLLPSFTPNPSQKRIGLRIAGVTVWLRPENAKDLAKQIMKEVK